jgi:3-hydroxybutyryl-CoA dehydrogenase
MERQVHREMITEDARDAALKRIKPAKSLEEFSKVDFAVEAATEKEDIKRKIFDELCPRLPKTAMLATNTSSISITRLGTATDRPERFIGLHFMNPVPMMRLVEVIRGLATDQETYDAAVGIVERLGKHGTNAEDFPAFIVRAYSTRCSLWSARRPAARRRPRRVRVVLDRRGSPRSRRALRSSSTEVSAST